MLSVQYFDNIPSILVLQHMEKWSQSYPQRLQKFLQYPKEYFGRMPQKLERRLKSL